MLAHAGAADESLAMAMVFVALWIGWVGWSRLRGTGFGRLPAAAGPGLLGVAAVVLVASAVVPRAVFGPTPVTPSASPSGARIASTATLAFEEPTDGEVVRRGELRIVLDLEGGTVVEETTSDVRPDTGHIHLSVDGELVSMTFGTVQVVALGSLDLPPGEHDLGAEYVAADHLPFAPPVTASTRFVMEAP